LEASGCQGHFSRVVREALELGPQRVTLHGKDAVMILSAENYRRLPPDATQPSLHALLSRSQLQDLGGRKREKPALSLGASAHIGKEEAVETDRLFELSILEASA
jgi:prevent-host-death family protein